MFLFLIIKSSKQTYVDSISFAYERYVKCIIIECYITDII